MKLRDVKDYLNECKSDYIDYKKRDEIPGRINDYLRSLKWYQRLWYAYFYGDYSLAKRISINPDKYVDQWNEEYIQRMMQEHAAFFNNIEGKALDEQQQRAVLTDEYANLVVAGAGSGKTLTIAAKVKYLCDIKKCDPNDILLLSFTRKAAGEMTDRISNRMGIDAKASTFHALGLGILSDSEGKLPAVEENPGRIISEFFRSNMSSEMMKDILRFIGIYHVIIEEDLTEGEKVKQYKGLGSNLRTLGSYVYPPMIETEINRLQQQLPSSDRPHRLELDKRIEELSERRITIANEVVRSLEEVRIANFLFLNGINYEYERHYPYDTKNDNRKQYRPDFYLPDYDIYWEHFGIDENGNAPWLSEAEEKKYKRGIDWKRWIHKNNNTKLIETYSYMAKADVVEENLKKILADNGVEARPIDIEKVYERLARDKDYKYMGEFVKLIATFIGLFKSQGYDSSWFDRFISDKSTTYRDALFLRIVKECYTFYQRELQRQEKIDFNDMINTATKIVESEGLSQRWKYIIVDEYQDISISRYRLLKAIADKTNAKVLCVGDDWQSIYRFAGSDITAFTSFEEFWGKSEVMKIEQTYRNSQELIDVAADFITKNPAQIKKELKSDIHNGRPFNFIPYEDKYADENDDDEIVSLPDALEDALDRICSMTFGKPCSVLLLGRHNFDKNLFMLSNEAGGRNNPDARFKVDADDEDHIICDSYPSLDIYYSTVHKAKGLEADYTIILNLRNDKFGFPNQMSDDPVLRFVLSDMDGYKFAEERRLFYVAITRTRNYVFMLEPLYNESVFLEEIIRDSMSGGYGAILNGEIPTKAVKTPNCPKCKTGKLIKRKGPHSDFVGCSNYPICDYTVRDTMAVDLAKECPVCGGFLVPRHGKYGDFYGCTNYPECTYTQRLLAGNDERVYK